MQTKQTPLSQVSKSAGSKLAKRLAKYSGDETALVLTMPNGGVPLAAHVAALLNKPFDVLFVEKITAPGCGGIALGSITGGGVRVINAALADRLRLGKEEINAAVLHGALKLARRERSCRGHHLPLQIAEHTIILIDDGCTPNSVLRDAIHLLRRQHAERIVVAFPTASRHTISDLSMEADEVVSLEESPPGTSGTWFEKFPRISDTEIHQFLSKKPPAAGDRN